MRMWMRRDCALRVAYGEYKSPSVGFVYEGLDRFVDVVRRCDRLCQQDSARTARPESSVPF